MKRLYFLIALLFASATASAQVFPDPQVDSDEVIRRGNFVEYVDGYGDDEDPIGEAMAPPPDDSHKWYVTVLTSPGCVHCEHLKRDFAESIYLRAFVTAEDYKKSWAHYNVYSMDDPTQAWRFKAPKSSLTIKGYPTLLIQPPFNAKYGKPETIVFQKTGYDGNAKKLAAQMSEAIKRYVQKVTPAVRTGLHRGGDRAQFRPVSYRAEKAETDDASRAQASDRADGPHKPSSARSFETDPPCDCGCPDCQCELCRCPRGALSREQSDPTAEDFDDPTAMVRRAPWGQRQPPWPTPDDNGPAPVVPPLVIPSPVDPDAPAPAPDQPDKPTTPDKPDAAEALPEAVLVVDSQNEQPVIEAQARRFLDRLRAERKPLRVRIVDFAFAKHLDVKRDETPAVVVTDGDRVEKITGRLLPFLAPEPLPPAAPVTIADLPWESLLLLLTGGGGIGAALPLIVFGIRWFRSRRQAAGKQALINDQTFAGILGLLQQIDFDKLLGQFKKTPPTS